MLGTALATALTDLFEGEDGFPANDAEVAEAWATIYRAYVAAAQAGKTGPLAVGTALDAARTRLVADLTAAFAAARDDGDDGLATIVARLDTAFRAFWLGPAGAPSPIAFVTPGAGTGTVTATPVSGALASLLSTVFAAGVPVTGPAPGAATQATAVAGALDTWTRGVTVSYTVPPSPTVITASVV